MKVISNKESHLKRRYAHPPTCCMTGNVDEGLRIARRRWKRARAKYLRKKNKVEWQSGLLHRTANAE